MPILGAHMSIAGGYDRAVQRARDAGCCCVQLFTKNNTQWRAVPITREQADRFHQAVRECGMSHPLAHDSYLINLASPDEDLWQKSLRAFVEELERAEILGIPYVVTHPGSYTESTPGAGIRRIVRALNRILKETRGMKAQCLLETTAGQGTSLGWRFEHLAMILDRVKEPERLGVCLDTCHVFAAGYAMGTRQQYEETLGSFDAMVGISRIKAVHLNDSARELGSRVDRHAHIGRGKMGLEPFRFLLSDPRLQSVPMYLETPKGQEHGEDLDVINLATLRGLIPHPGGCPPDS
jgi:deoxyribonuclease-4